MERKWSQGLFSGAQCQEKRQWAQTRTQEAPFEHQKALLCCVWVVEHWNRLPRDVVEFLSWGIFKRCLDMVLGTLLEQRFNRWTSCQSQPFCSSFILWWLSCTGKPWVGPHTADVCHQYWAEDHTLNMLVAQHARSTVFLLHSWKLLAFFASKMYCRLMAILLSMRNAGFFSAKLLSIWLTISKHRAIPSHMQSSQMHPIKMRDTFSL